VNAAALDARVWRSIRRAPDSRADEIARRLGDVDVYDVSLALKRLRRSKRVKSRGKTRATTYRVTV